MKDPDVGSQTAALDPRSATGASGPSNSPRGARTLKAHSLGALLRVLRLGPFLILVVLCLVMWALQPAFGSETNIQNILLQCSVIALLALGQFVVVVTRGIDLSAGAGLALASVVGAYAYKSGLLRSGVAVICVMLAVGLCLGFANGILYVLGRVPHPFIVTLATFSIANGLALTFSKGQSIIGTAPIVNALGNNFISVVPVSAVVVAVAVLAVGILTRRTQWGRWVFATGGDPNAAARVGIPVPRVLVSVYVFSGLLTGIAAIITSGQIAGGSPTVGGLQGLTDAIAAVIIGGVSLLGGVGSAWNALVGALTVAVIYNGLDLLGINPSLEYVFIGATILVAVELDVIRGRLERRLRTLRTSEAVA